MWLKWASVCFKVVFFFRLSTSGVQFSDALISLISFRWTRACFVWIQEAGHLGKPWCTSIPVRLFSFPLSISVHQKHTVWQLNFLCSCPLWHRPERLHIFVVSCCSTTKRGNWLCTASLSLYGRSENRKVVGIPTLPRTWLNVQGIPQLLGLFECSTESTREMWGWLM